MNIENLRKVVDALKSGRYAKTIGALRRYAPLNGKPIGFCCLGVACDVFHNETGHGQWMNTENGREQFVVSGYTSNNYLPLPVAKWLGLKIDGAISPDDIRIDDPNFPDATRLNDASSDWQPIIEAFERTYPELLQEPTPPQT